MQKLLLKIYQHNGDCVHKYTILLTIGIPRIVNKKSSGEIICAGRKGGVSLQCHDKLLVTSD